MKYLICYDVTETRIRSKMSKYLEGFGHRIQYSVFICEASTEKIVGAKKKLERLAAKSSKRMILILPVVKIVQAEYGRMGNLLKENQFIS